MVLKELLLVGAAGLFFNLFAADTVIDRETKLEWQDNEEKSEALWKIARGYCQGLKLNGHDDWRLPTLKELHYLAASKSLQKEFKTLQTHVYWSSDIDKNDEFSAMCLYSGNGFVSSNDKCDKNFVLCVRDLKE